MVHSAINEGLKSSSALQEKETPICLQHTQVPVRQRIIIIIFILIYVLPLLALPSFMLQSDGAGLVEARLDVLFTVWNRLILFNVALEGSRIR